MLLTETLLVTLDIMSIMESLNIPCLVGGSVASSLHGIPRATQDVDIVAQLNARQVSALVGCLAGRYYVDEPSIRDAIQRSASFNVIHLDSMYKIDVFICGDDEHRLEEFSRARRITVDSEQGRSFFVADAADIIIQKLLWYEAGNRISTRQWKDVLGVITICDETLDREYLYRWGLHKKILKLMDQAFAEAGVRGVLAEGKTES